MFAFLAAHRLALFPASMFSDLFPTDRGRPSIPPDVVASVLVLQSLHGLSDRQAAEAVLFDLRWKAACGLAITDTSFHPTTLTYWRQRLAASDSPNRIFDAVKAVVVATGVLKGKTRRALDSTVLDDAVATGGHRDAVGRGDPPGGPGGARRRSGGRVDIDGPLRPARRTRHRLGRPSRSALLVGGHPGPGTCWRCWPL